MKPKKIEFKCECCKKKATCIIDLEKLENLDLIKLLQNKIYSCDLCKEHLRKDIVNKINKIISKYNKKWGKEYYKKLK